MSFYGAVRGSFPFLFGGTFIEGTRFGMARCMSGQFPFLFGGTFIEGCIAAAPVKVSCEFPFLFGGTFIEGQIRRACPHEPTQISLPFWRGFH